MADPSAPRTRELRSGRRMTDIEALMWTVEKDPYLSSTFGNISVLDQVPDLDYFRARMLQTTHRIPRLRQRVTAGLGRLAPPEWQEDPDFDIDFHVRRIALPSPATMTELDALACMLVQDPFDRTRPLWEFTVVEGLEGGRAAIVQKMHHTITDGEGGIRMSEQFIDISREPPPLETTELAPSEETRPNLVEATVDSLAHTWRRGLGATQRTLEDVASNPGRLLALPAEVGDVAVATVRQVTVTDRARSPLWGTRSLRRHLETFDVDFDEAKTASKVLGGSLNDFFVTGAARGAGRYHHLMGEPAQALRMAMPVSTRSDGSAGGNSFVPTRLLVPTDVVDPVEHFHAVHEVLSTTKDDRVVGAMGAVAGLANLLPTSVLVRFTRQQVETIDFTTSNLRAAPFDLFIAGAHLEANYPLGPLAGTAFNLTMMSYRGALNMGLHIDAAAIAEPVTLRREIEGAYAELIGAAS